MQILEDTIHSVDAHSSNTTQCRTAAYRSLIVLTNDNNTGHGRFYLGTLALTGALLTVGSTHQPYKIYSYLVHWPLTHTRTYSTAGLLRKYSVLGNITPKWAGHVMVCCTRCPRTTRLLSLLSILPPSPPDDINVSTTDTRGVYCILPKMCTSNTKREQTGMG